AMSGRTGFPSQEEKTLTVSAAAVSAGISFVSYRRSSDATPEMGVVQGERVIPLSRVPGFRADILHACDRSHAVAGSLDELVHAVVIGRSGKHIAVADALDHVAGYAVMNDVSARDLQLQTSQWTAGKTLDTFAPFGPGLVPRSLIADPQNLRIETRVNGTVMQ